MSEEELKNALTVSGSARRGAHRTVHRGRKAGVERLNQLRKSEGNTGANRDETTI